MFITNPEYDFWPWTWIHDGRECSSLNDLQAAWKSIDPRTDSIFDPKKHNHANGYGDKFTTKISDNIECVSHHADISNKIALEDYKDFAIKKFDKQMQNIVNRHKKVVVGLSGGIDSTLTLAWLVKNKVDFESFVGRGDPWRGSINNMLESNAIEMAKLLGIKNHVIDFNHPQFDKHDMVRQYLLADKYDYPCISYVTQPPGSLYLLDLPFDGQIVAPVGIDDLLLHRVSSWARFIPDHMLKTLKTYSLPADRITDYGYQIGGYSLKWPEPMDPSLGRQGFHRWADDLLFQMAKDWICSPATSQEWFEAWLRIDNTSCDVDQLRDLMGVGWLKRQIIEWTGKDFTSLIKSSTCTENYYTPNQTNREYVLQECKKNQDLYREVKNVSQQLYWKSTIDVIKMWNKVSPEVAHAIHVLNWLRKHR